MPKFITKTYPAAALVPCDPVPALSADREKKQFASTITDYEGLFLNYGYRETAYPYTMQNLYSEESPRPVHVAVLENDRLYAEFLVDFGGRLWKLYDKQRRRDVLYTNDVIRLRNLAIRNAWFSGGVEWNCGIIGHSPFTCSRMYCAAVTGKGGQDVLRFYEYERVRGMYYQMDFWLEEDRLMTQVRIENPNETVVPMYWWSNMATPEYPDGRVIVDADSAYNNSDGMGVKKSPIPVDNGIDVSYPEHIPTTMDYFYRVPATADKFIANVDPDGYGLLQFSGHRLQGRKLFSWGHLQGSKSWQNLLTDQAGDYVEIQAGLGKTQYECIPMPPKTAWCFSECYTLANLAGVEINAPYRDLVAAVQAQMAGIYTSDQLDGLARENEQDISLQPGKVIYNGSGYGYLVDALTHTAPAHLTFAPDDTVAPYLALLEGKPMTGTPAFAYGAAMERLLDDHADDPCWQIPYQKALLLYDRRDFAGAAARCQTAFLYDNNAYLNHLYAHILYQLGDRRASYFAKKAIAQAPDNYALCESLAVLLLAGGDYRAVVDSCAQMAPSIAALPRLQMYLSRAWLELGDAKKAEQILLADGGLQLTDFREGDRFLDRLYRRIRVALYGEQYKEIIVPQKFDFIVSDFKTD